MPKGRRGIPYTDWLLSGKPIFLAEGVDFHCLSSEMRQRLHQAGKRRGLKVATKTIFNPPGFVFQAYLPHHIRPELPDPTQTVAKKTHPHLYCRENGCDTRLTPKDSEFCANHAI